MKKLITKAGLFVASAVALLGVSLPAQADQTGISEVTENSPLYLDHAPAQTANGDVVVGYHYSHQSHQSHESHYSHRSHYSGY